MHSASGNKVFVAASANAGLTVDAQYHFALDNNAPLRVGVVVLRQVYACVKLEKHQLPHIRLHYPGSGAFEGYLGFWKVSYQFWVA